mgnify:CR=1 FL=1
MSIAWCNGVWSETGEFALPLDSPGLRFGAGVFETLLYNGERVCHLPLHLRRLSSTLDGFGFPLPDHPWHSIVREVATRNLPGGGPGRINVLCWFADAEGELAIAVTARPTVRLGADATMRISLEHAVERSPMPTLKTMNYLPHWLAWRRAKGSGFDDAAILDTDGSILECTRGALVSMPPGGEMFSSFPEKRLSSISLELIAGAEGLHSASGAKLFLPGSRVFYVNSLVGARPVVALGSHSFDADFATASRLTALICPPAVE